MNQITASNQSVKLIEKDGKLYASSLEIAEHFQKEHKNVLRDIANLDCSEQFSRLNFEPSNYESGKKKKVGELKIQPTSTQIKLIERSGKYYASSLELAEKLGRAHKGIIKIIKEALSQKELEHEKRGPKTMRAGELKFLSESEISEHKEFGLLNFGETSYLDSTGRTLKAYEMTRDGLSYVTMKCSGPRATIWRIRYIKAFNLLEAQVIQRGTPEWEAARISGKQQRREVTDTIQKFIDYAVAQGSNGYKTNPSLAYSNISKAINKALFMLSHVVPGFRDRIDAMDLSNLKIAERGIQKTLEDNMNHNLHYKDIYRNCKITLDNYIAIVGTTDKRGFLLERQSSKKANLPSSSC